MSTCACCLFVSKFKNTWNNNFDNKYILRILLLYVLICLKMFFVDIKKMVIFVLTISISTIFWYVVFSDAVNTRYTEFYFSSGWEYSKNILVSLTWSHTGSVSVYLENKSTSTLNGKLSFVDGGIVQYWSTWVKICKSENEKDVFGNYVSVDTDSFSIVSNWNITKSINLLFPSWYSWLYHWCVIYYPNISESNWSLNTTARKAIFLDANVFSSAKEFAITVRPAFRRFQWDWYSIPQADFWLFSYEWWVRNEIYNSSKNILNPKIDIDTNGFGIVNLVPLSSGTQYLVAFKWSGTISVWYTGVWDDNLNAFNFFSGEIANKLPDDYVFKYPVWWVTWNYLRVWDLANSPWTYDLIKDPDFTLMTNSLTISFGALHLDWYDLDRNNKINALEQTMLLDSFNRRGFITSQWYLSLSDFVEL